MKRLIAPSILSADFGKLESEIRRCEDAGVDMLHIDVMDGHFVPNLTLGPCVVKSLRPITELPFDVHLMVTDPLDFIEPFASAGADYLTFHVESNSPLEKCLELARSMGVKPGLVVNPPTPVDSALPLLDRLDMLLVMSVNPGFAGQGFMPEVLPKLERCMNERKRRRLKFLLQIDGGITDKTVARAANAGADVFVSGSYLFKGGDMREKVRLLQQSV